jgi:hypothetical protein
MRVQAATRTVTDGMTVRPNHLGIALQRHRRAGRLENRDQRWYLPASAQSEQ